MLRRSPDITTGYINPLSWKRLGDPHAKEQGLELSLA